METMYARRGSSRLEWRLLHLVVVHGPLGQSQAPRVDLMRRIDPEFMAPEE